MIEFDGVVARYARAAVPALAGVSLEATRGRLTAVVGPNGSGKSTLIRTLLGQVTLESGTVRIDGVHASSLSRRAVATRVSVVTQREEPSIPLAVKDYVALGRYPHLGLLRGVSPHDRGTIENAIERTDTTGLRDRAVTELSGGEWQRVRLARAIAQGGDAIVLDEPTTFLDIAHEMAVFELLGGLAREGRAVLLVSHQLNLVARFAEHLVLLSRGRVEASGTPDEVMQGAILERVYEWPLVVTRDPAVGAPSLVPLRVAPRR